MSALTDIIRRTGLAIALFFTLFSARADQIIYDDARQNGWQDYGWATLNYTNTAFVHSGTNSISVSGNAWEAIYLHHPAFNSTGYTNLSFWINGGASGGQLLQVQALSNGVAKAAFNLPSLPANSWQHFTIPLSSLGMNNQPNLDGFWIQDRSGASFSTFYVDDMSLISTGTVTLLTNIIVDVAQNRHLIAPEVYGLAFASSNELADLNVPLNRSGGNATTRYNWQQNASQRAADWYFESIPSTRAVPGADGDDFISESRIGHAEPMLTIPTIGWVADVGTNRQTRWSYSISKYGAQTGHDPYQSDAGNGTLSSGSKPITTNNPLDANKVADSNFQKGWIQHLTNQWGHASNGGLRYYLLDNEPSIWQGTHRDVFPTGPTMAAIRDRIIDYGTMIKSVDPGAIIFGPEEWGWSGYLYSGYDQQYSATNNYSVFPDKTAHGGWDYLPWLLDQLRQTNNATGQRVLDVFSVHYYPQGGEFSTNVTTAMQLLRNQSTRSLWDSTYVDQSWIGDVVQLVPRLKNWVATNYPGTKTALTEYNWGAEDHINGATTQADILGILGREGIDYATRWTTPTNTSPTYNAIKMYRNYDGQKSSFGNLSVSTLMPNPDQISAFAAIRTNNFTLTLMVINKALDATNTPMPIQLTNFLMASTAKVYQLNSSNIIRRLTDVTNITGQFTYSFPPQSITLFVIPQGPPPTITPSGFSSNQLNLTISGRPGVKYVTEVSTNLVNWTPYSTNTLTTNTFTFPAPLTTQRQYYRAVWKP